MRILASFFTILFIFINPVMIAKVVSEMERFFVTKLPDHLQLRIVEAVIGYFTAHQLGARLKTIVYASVLTMSLLHIVLTCCSLYGIYSCRPAFIRPLLVDIAFSFIILLIFVAFSLTLYWRVNTVGVREDHDIMKTHMRNVYVGGAFLLAYIVWLVVTLAGYRDTKKLHADFMYWIVEERMSMRSKGHNVSVDNSGRSDRSSKGSRTSRVSKASNRSARSEVWAHSRPNSVTTSICSTRQGANARLSVPL